MKKFLIILFPAIIILFASVTAGIYFWIDYALKENIKIAKQKYPGGKAEDVLIAYLEDTTNSPEDRSHIAVWTLGQIQSEKGMSILMKYYKNDPEGKTCKDLHDSVLCQYEIYKALHTKEVNGWPLHSRLN